MKNYKRSLRRRHYERLKKRASKIYPWTPCGKTGIYANTMKRCSGSCCGNPRRHFGQKDALTKQEIVFFSDDVSELLEEERQVGNATGENL